MKLKIFFALLICLPLTQRLWAQSVQWVATGQNFSFKNQGKLPVSSSGEYDAEIELNKPLQKISGFGGCFNELGWTSLKYLSGKDRQAVMRELFEPGYGACFNICRMPVGANDFSLKWYSYDETAGDFGMKHFTIANDLQTLVPYIKNAQRYNPSLQLWASPWSPPEWMKYNHHYAEQMFPPGSPYNNGLQPGQVGHPGENLFIQQNRYFAAYALYFQDFIKAYRERGINIGMVMPQNEFLAAQVFPSCTWTAAGLVKFLSYLGPAMQKQHVKVFFGTMNSGNALLADTILSSPLVSKYIKGAAFQWAGKNAIGTIHREYPNLTLYQSEQECGNGKNDWQYCVYTWGLLKRYLNNGANAYMYWNISLLKGGVSHWGWTQNSLVTVDSAAKTFKFNYEYYLLKQVSHFVKPGARLLSISGGFNDMLAFKNPDNSIVLVIRNADGTDKKLCLKIGGKYISPVLKADTFNTIVLKGINMKG